MFWTGLLFIIRRYCSVCTAMVIWKKGPQHVAAIIIYYNLIKYKVVYDYILYYILARISISKVRWLCLPDFKEKNGKMAQMKLTRMSNKNFITFGCKLTWTTLVLILYEPMAFCLVTITTVVKIHHLVISGGELKGGSTPRQRDWRNLICRGTCMWT